MVNQRKDSSVAQLVEQAAVNRRVVGSSPTGGALVFELKPALPGFFYALAEGFDVLRLRFAVAEFPETIRRTDCGL